MSCMPFRLLFGRRCGKCEQNVEVLRLLWNTRSHSRSATHQLISDFSTRSSVEES